MQNNRGISNEKIAKNGHFWWISEKLCHHPVFISSGQAVLTLFIVLMINSLSPAPLLIARVMRMWPICRTDYLAVADQWNTRQVQGSNADIEHNFNKSLHKVCQQLAARRGLLPAAQCAECWRVDMIFQLISLGSRVPASQEPDRGPRHPLTFVWVVSSQDTVMDTKVEFLNLLTYLLTHLLTFINIQYLEKVILLSRYWKFLPQILCILHFIKVLMSNWGTLVGTASLMRGLYLIVT